MVPPVPTHPVRAQARKQEAQAQELRTLRRVNESLQASTSDAARNAAKVRTSLPPACAVAQSACGTGADNTRTTYGVQVKQQGEQLMGARAALTKLLLENSAQGKTSKAAHHHQSTGFGHT